MSDPENTDETQDAPPEITFQPDDGASSISPNSIEGIFLAALRKDDPAERNVWLDEICGGDEDQRLRVAALLRAYDDAGSFMQKPASDMAAGGEISLSFLKPLDKDGCLGTIGPYEVLEVIGRGGMGLVLRAVDPKLNRIVAVKVLIPELAANPNARRRFLREAQAAAAISHPHVVTIHAVEEADEGGDTQKSTPPFLVMECVVGQSLQQKLDAVGPMRLPEIVRISRQISEGLAAAHRQGVIHRDIKPANILLENGVERVKITDFGLARAVDDITVTRTGEVSGTPQYMSPEQANGERVDHRSDLFSLGCVMYAMCTGHSPFRGDSIAHVIKRVTQDTPRPIAEQHSEIPTWLIQIIDCLLQKHADQRFQSAEGLVAILDQHLARIQQPTGSGSHSLINRQLPIPDAVPDVANVAVPGPPAAEVSAASHSITQANHIRVPGWLRSIGRILIAVGAIGVAVILIGSSSGVGIGSKESMVVFLFGAWPILMGSFLCRHTMTREALLAVLFLGLGPLGLVIYLFVSDKLQTATVADYPPPWSRYQVGTRLVGAGALIIFSMVAWFILVGFEFIDAPQVARQNAQWVFAASILAATALIVPGMLLRGEILGNQPLSSLFGLSGMTLLGPLGIWYWMSVMQKEAKKEALSEALEPHTVPPAPVPPEPTARMVANPEMPETSGSAVAAVGDAHSATGRSRIALARIFRILVVITVFGAAWFVKSRMEHTSQASGGRSIVIHHHGKQKPAEIFIEGEQVAAGTQTETLTHVFGVKPGIHDIAITMFDQSNKQHVLRHQVLVKADKAAEVDLCLPVEFNAADQLGPADTAYGGLILEIADSGLHVLLLGMGPDMMGYYPMEIPAGRHKVPAGRYNVMVFDKLAGWLNDVKSRPNGDYEKIFNNIDRSLGALNHSLNLYDRKTGAWSVAQYSAEPDIVEIKSGEFQNVVASRQLKKLAGRADGVENSRGIQRFVEEKFYRFLWNGNTYSLSASQARVINELLQRKLAGDRSADERSLLTALTESGVATTESISAIFNDGKHPAWNDLIRYVGSGENRGVELAALIATRTTDVPATVESIESSASLPLKADAVAPVVVMSAEPGEGERAGRLDVTIEDDGMRLVVRRKSAFGGYVPGSEQQVDNVGLSHLRLHPGDYELGIQDRHFGWPMKFRTSEINIKNGSLNQFSVRRDLSALPSAQHMGVFLWDGKEIRPSEFKSWDVNQDFAINLLLKSYDIPIATEELVAKTSEHIRALRKTHGNNIYRVSVPTTIRDIFDPLPGFIKADIPKDTLRIAPPPRATVDVSVIGKGIGISLTPLDEKSEVSHRHLGGFSTNASAEYRLPPGSYEINVSDSLAHWSQFDESTFQGRNLTKKTVKLNLKAGDREKLTFTRDLQALVDFDASLVPLADNESLRFWWGESGGFASPSCKCNEAQAKCMRRLLQALIDGNPDVPEASLQEATGQTMEELFPGPRRESQHFLLIKPGEQPNSWRLAPLKE